MVATALKWIISATLVVAASEAAKRNAVAGALLISLPLTSLQSIGWLWHDTRDVEAVANMASSVLWLVLPSLVFFVLFPAALRAGWGFGLSMGVGVGATVVAYRLTLMALQSFGASGGS